MWIVAGAGAVIFAVLNLVWLLQRKSSKWFGFISLSLTALTVCFFYSDAARRVMEEDWAGLMDILPTMRTALFFCVIASILINSIPLFIKPHSK